MSYITDEQIGQIAEQVGLVGPTSRVGDCHAASLRFARAILALAAPAVPSGWKLVPVEPTDRMVEAAHGAGWSRVDIYSAMLTAAPTPPAQTPEPSEAPRES